jgi:hypothetical protein
VRSEWRNLGISLAAPTLVGLISFLIYPSAWFAWVAFLTSHVGEASGSVGVPFVPGPVFRWPIALVLVIWGARTNRAWVLAASMCLATPVIGPAVLSMLAAIPRLRSVSSTDWASRSRRPRTTESAARGRVLLAGGGSRY